MLASLATHEAPSPRARTTAIELIDAREPPRVPPPITSEAEASLGGSRASERPAPRVAARAARRDVAHDDGDPRGAIRIESRSDGDTSGDGGAAGNGAGDGAGAGPGGGRGQGIGLGEGARIAHQTTAFVTPPAPAASKARPATLVYPAREREVDDAELFVARVTIDHEGFVVGAVLVRGFGGPHDAMAADLIWKFRYAPALDDEGRPIRSTLDQKFLVGR